MEFLYTLVILTVAIGVGGVICHAGMRDAVRGALGALMLASMILPFVGAVSELCDIDFSGVGSEVDGGFAEITSTAFAEGIGSAIAEKFSMKEPPDVIVRDFSPSVLSAESITVVIPSDCPLVDFRRVRDFVEENFTRVGGCEVVYG